MRIDGHIHMLLDGVDWKKAIDRHRQAPDDEWIRQQLEIYHRLGFTYLRDGGDRWNVGARARTIAREFGIAYRTPLAPLCRKGHYGNFIGETYETMDEFRKCVEKNRKNGGDFVKIMISGLMDFDHCGVLTEEGLDPQDIGELIAIAHGEGFSVMAHANGAETVAAAARAGVDSVEHGAYLDQRARDAMGEHQVIWVPTLSTVGNLRGTGRFREEAVEEILETARENVREFARQGGWIAPGTDAGAWAVPHGSMTEYQLMEETLGTGWEEILDRGSRELIRRF